MRYCVRNQLNSKWPRSSSNTTEHFWLAESIKKTRLASIYWKVESPHKWNRTFNWIAANQFYLCNFFKKFYILLLHVEIIINWWLFSPHSGIKYFMIRINNHVEEKAEVKFCDWTLKLAAVNNMQDRQLIKITY